MEAVLKSYRYRLVDNHDFEMPLPLKFEILKKDCPIAEYEISENEEVSFRILTKYKEDMLTTVLSPYPNFGYLLSFLLPRFSGRNSLYAVGTGIIGIEQIQCI